MTDFAGKATRAERRHQLPYTFSRSEWFEHGHDAEVYASEAMVSVDGWLPAGATNPYVSEPRRISTARTA